MPGVMTCGATERTGASGATMNRLVTCPACRALIVERQAAAKERARRAGA
jgi:hypothetical protein